ncbi:MAG: hypothetical protein JF612_01690, partial [Planctomycetia bacterium]|nr:hypothetical protein [Planctomycetia bacterium]
IQDGSFLQSAAGTYTRTGNQIITGSASPSGKVSNAPPIIELHQINPNDVLLPGDPTQEVTGQIGVSSNNLELGSNLTLSVVWADGKTSVLTGLQAGDTVTWHIGPDGNTSSVSITHAAEAKGPIIIHEIQRAYDLQFLATFQSNKVDAIFTLSNDRMIHLTDSRSLANAEILNVSEPITVSTTLSNKDFSRPPIVIPASPIVQVAETRVVVRNENILVLPQQIQRLQDVNFAQGIAEVEDAVLFLVAVGPDGTEGPPLMLAVSDLRNVSALLERLRKAQIPSGLYRLYYKEPGLPPQLVLEFRKTGNAIGDPVREPGRGTNPLDAQPAQPPAAPPGGQQNPQDQNMGQLPTPNAHPRDAQVESTLVAAAQQSFTRAARLLRSWMR